MPRSAAGPEIAIRGWFVILDPQDARKISRTWRDYLLEMKESLGVARWVYQEFITPETRNEMVNRTDWGDVLPPTGVQPQPKLEPTTGIWKWLGIRPPEF